MLVLRMMIILVALLLNTCAFKPQKVSVDDTKVQSLLKAATSFDRTSYGFSPIPNKDANFSLELRTSGQYDAMLHIAAKTSRTIAFRKENGNYVWIGEQEKFNGPKTYKSEDGTLNEAVALTYETQKISGYPPNQLNVMYFGDDPRLSGRSNLTLNDVKPVLKEWSY